MRRLLAAGISQPLRAAAGLALALRTARSRCLVPNALEPTSRRWQLAAAPARPELHGST